MKEKEGDCKEAYRKFQKQYSKFLGQPIIRSFLKDRNHYELVQQAVCSPTKENRQRVDEAFQSFYGSVKALTYLSNLIHFNAINFDKTIKKHYNREMLTLYMLNERISVYFGTDFKHVQQLYEKL